MKRARTARHWTQAELATRLGVSQGYVCLLERGARPVPTSLARTLARLLERPPSALPASADSDADDAGGAARARAALGYARFADRRRRSERRNPAVLVLRCLRAPDVDARIVEALVWLLVPNATA